MTDTPEKTENAMPLIDPPQEGPLSYTEEEILAKIMDGLERYNRNVQEWLGIFMTPDERTKSDLRPSLEAETWRDRPPLL